MRMPLRRYAGNYGRLRATGASRPRGRYAVAGYALCAGAGRYANAWAARSPVWAVALLLALAQLAAACPQALAGSVAAPRHLASVTRSAETGPLGLLGGVFYDDQRRRLYVADTSGGRILAFDDEFAFASQFDGGGALSAPSALVRDGQGVFHVIQAGEGAVLSVDMAARTMRPLDMSGAPGANAPHPVNLALDEAGDLYVADAANQQVLVFGADRSLRRAFPVDRCRGLRDVKVQGGRVYTANALSGNVCVYGTDGKFQDRFGERGRGKGRLSFPVSLAVDPRGRVYVLDKHRSTVAVYTAKGRFIEDVSREGWREGRLHFPTFIYRNGAGRLFVVDRQNERVSVFETGR